MRYLVLICGVVLFWTPGVCGITYTVCPDGSGDFLRIQDAIDVAADGDVIELCCDAIFHGVGNRDLDFAGRAITVRSACDDATRCIVDCEGTWSQFRRGFIFHCAEGPDSRVAGITITQGVAAHGGAIHCSSSSPTFADCILTENEIADVGGRGAAVYCWNSSPAFVDCAFADNACTCSWCEGGALACRYSSPVLSGCTFTDNTAGNTGAGGAIWCHNGSLAIFEDCVFTGNEGAVGGGAVQCSHASDALFTDCIFCDNTGGAGGAVWIDSSAVVLTRCTIVRNTGCYGGAVAIADANPRLVGCTISHNAVDIFGAGIYSSNSAPVLENTIISFNTGSRAVFLQGSGVPTLTCCDIYGNPGGDWTWPIIHQLEINGNICLDPCYCDAGLDDYQLWNYSPCNQEGCGLIGAWPLGCWDPQETREEDPVVPVSAVEFRLLPNVPNPFVATTRIDYTVPRSAGHNPVILRVYDATGRLVRNLVSDVRPVGTHSVAWDATNQEGRPVPAGVYLYRLRLGKKTITRQMIVAR